MSGKVIADGRFLTPERLLELQEQGDVEVSLQSVLDGLELGDPKPGEKVVGTLTTAEARLYRQLYESNLLGEDFMRDAVGRQLTKVGETLRTSDRSRPVADLFANGGLQLEDEEDTRKFHRLKQHTSMLHACFYYHVGERLDLHEWRLGVRSNGRIVRIELR